MTSTQAFLSTPYYPRQTFARYSSFLPFFVHNMRQPLYEVRSQHTCFLRNHLLLFTLRDHYFINPLWISRLNTQIFVSKVVWRCNLVKVLGQQPRYQRVPSSVTMWQLFHRGPRFHRGSISYLPGNYYQLTRNEDGGVIDHRVRGVLQGKIQTIRVPFTTRDKDFKSNNGFDLKRFKCSTGTSTISRYSVLCYPITTGLLASKW